MSVWAGVGGEFQATARYVGGTFKFVGGKWTIICI